jgi:hypothetical protein
MAMSREEMRKAFNEEAGTGRRAKIVVALVVAAIVLAAVVLIVTGQLTLPAMGNSTSSNETAPEGIVDMMSQQIRILDVDRALTEIMVLNTGSAAVSGKDLSLYKDRVYRHCDWVPLSAAPGETMKCRLDEPCAAGTRITIAAPGNENTEIC